MIFFGRRKKKWAMEGAPSEKATMTSIGTCQRFDLHLDHNRYRSPIVVGGCLADPDGWSLWCFGY